LNSANENELNNENNISEGDAESSPTMMQEQSTLKLIFVSILIGKQ